MNTSVHKHLQGDSSIFSNMGSKTKSKPTFCFPKLNPKSCFRVTVRAALDVNKGEELYSSYTYSLWPTLVRREFLRESKYFDCTCARCSDKTELGTHCGTLKCQRCDNGVILSTEPLGNTKFMFLSVNFFFISHTFLISVDFYYFR